VATVSNTEQINWSRKSLAELQRYWNTRIEPDLAQDGVALDDRPTYEALTDAGYSGIVYTLREHHDLTLAQFLATVGYDTPHSDDYAWGITDDPTMHELELYLWTTLDRKGHAKSTIESKRARLARFVRTYADRYGSCDIVSRVREDETPRRDEKQRVRAVFDQFDDDLTSTESKYKHVVDVRLFFEWLEQDRDASYNPASGAPQEHNWRTATPAVDDRDPPALAAHHVRSLVDACDSVTDHLLVVAVCAWGLRRGEVAALSIDQFASTDDSEGVDVDSEDPHIVFETRKNGPGRVSVLYGVATLADRVAQLGAREGWAEDGYLFPSSHAASGHVTPDTITNRFVRLADRADVTVREETPTPQYGRRFWFRTYADAVTALSEQIATIADEQGSDNERVVVENYLGEDEARRRRRGLMADRLAAAFET